MPSKHKNNTRLPSGLGTPFTMATRHHANIINLQIFCTNRTVLSYMAAQLVFQAVKKHSFYLYLGNVSKIAR